jgi:hypothetical protein
MKEQVGTNLNKTNRPSDDLILLPPHHTSTHRVHEAGHLIFLPFWCHSFYIRDRTTPKDFGICHCIVSTVCNYKRTDHGRSHFGKRCNRHSQPKLLLLNAPPAQALCTITAVWILKLPRGRVVVKTVRQTVSGNTCLVTWPI